jgi:hypothetical protein
MLPQGQKFLRFSLLTKIPAFAFQCISRLVSVKIPLQEPVERPWEPFFRRFTLGKIFIRL